LGAAGKVANLVPLLFNEYEAEQIIILQVGPRRQSLSNDHAVAAPLDLFVADRGIVEADVCRCSAIGPQRRKGEVEFIRVWLEKVPEDAVSARERAREMMEWHEGGSGKGLPFWTHG
jgi:N-dimethylarginine dimethylaminohydrolase